MTRPRFIDCPRCGCRVIESRWTEHEAGHDSGALPVLSLEDAGRVSEIAHGIALEDYLPEDFPQPSKWTP